MLYHGLDRLQGIGPDDLEKSVSILAHNAAHERERLQILLTLRNSSLIGRTVNKSIEPDLQALFPAYSVHYGISEYTKDRHRTLYMTKKDTQREDRPQVRFNVTLATVAAPKLETAFLDHQIEKARQDIAKYSHMAEELPANVAQWNNAIRFLRPIKDALSTAFIYSEPHNG